MFNSKKIMTHTRYLKIFGICSVCSFILIVLFNLFVDPYDLHQLVRLSGINAKKPEFRKHTYMGKAYAVIRIKPQSLILGTSRVENGIDPLHPGWRYHPVYNLGLAGSNIYEAFRYYQHAYAIQPLKEVVIGLDLVMFNGANANSPNFDEARLRVDRSGNPQPRYYRDLLTSVATLSALSDTIDTLSRQSKNTNVLYLPQGQRDPRFHLYRTREAGGCRNRFVKSARVYLGPGCQLFSVYRDKRYFVEPGSGKNTLDVYRALLRHAYTHNVNLFCFISPAHAWYWEVIRLDGMWPVLEMWKKEMVRINEEEARSAGKPPFPLWDFSGYNTLTTETVPPPDEPDTLMQWHWEASHYKKELGDIVLDIILHYSRGGKAIPPDFGAPLNSQNIGRHLNDIMRQGEAYRRRVPADIALLESLARAQAEKKRVADTLGKNDDE